jgi:hypothetical protein
MEDMRCRKQGFRPRAAVHINSARRRTAEPDFLPLSDYLPLTAAPLAFIFRSVTPAPPLTEDYDPLGPLRPVFRRLLRFASELFIELRSAHPERPRPYLPRIARRNLPAARTRVSHALNWLIALHRTLAGDRLYLPATPIAQPPTQPRATPAPKPRAPRRAPTERDRECAQLARIRRAFATLPTGLIAERIAARLGLRRGDGLWPHELTGITQTPAQLRAEIIAEYQAANPVQIPPHQPAAPKTSQAPPAPAALPPKTHDPPPD